MIFDQQEFDVRFEWGEHGVAVLAPISQAVIIVDVLSFSTSVEIAVHRAVALAAKGYGRKIAVIAAGERWQEDSSLRPSLEDLIGAGAIISYLDGRLSPEAASAVAAFRAARPRLGEVLRQCSSGKELIESGCSEDVSLASRLNASDSAPVLVDGAFVRAEAKAQGA